MTKSVGTGAQTTPIMMSQLSLVNFVTVPVRRVTSTMVTSAQVVMLALNSNS